MKKNENIKCPECFSYDRIYITKYKSIYAYQCQECDVQYAYNKKYPHLECYTNFYCPKCESLDIERTNWFIKCNKCFYTTPPEECPYPIYRI